MSDYVIVNGELYHYGVPGMRWGVRRARKKQASISKLERKAINYDKKSAKLAKKSERIHAKKDLGRSNSYARKANKYKIKAANVEKKMLKTDNDSERLGLEKKAAKYQHKAAKKMVKANQISKSVGYGKKAMKYSVKSDRVARKAAKARLKIANDKAYIDMMNRKASSLSKEELQGAYSFVNDFLKDDK